MSGERVVLDHLLLEDGAKLQLESLFQVGSVMLETSVLSDQTSTNQLTKAVDFQFVSLNDRSKDKRAT